jgi:hypothetical protein
MGNLQHQHDEQTQPLLKRIQYFLRFKDFQAGRQKLSRDDILPLAVIFLSGIAILSIIIWIAV